MAYHILVADPDTGRAGGIVERLARDGYDVQSGSHLEAEPGGALPDLLLVDASLLDSAGRIRLHALRSRAPALSVILLGEAMRGTLAKEEEFAEILSRRVDPDLVARSVRRVMEAAGLREEARRRYGLAALIGGSRPIRTVLKNALDVARSEAPAILIRGESGTGKDLLARAIHYESSRAGRPFITVMCTTLQDTLLENELFGHEKGAYTDAKGQKRGVFETADGGTIFLNEIGEMSPQLQAKLLQVLDEQTFRRVGGSEDVRVDVRVIAATNRDLEQSIRTGEFRMDLFYRLNIFPILLPPLRERLDDIPLFVAHFLQRNERKYRRTFTGLGPKAVAKLKAYRWPGNVRELRNVLERACALGTGPEIREGDLQFWEIGAQPGPGHTVLLPPEGLVLEDVERDLVAQALERTLGNQSKAAALLGISRFRLRCRMKRYGLPPKMPDVHP